MLPERRKSADLLWLPALVGSLLWAIATFLRRKFYPYNWRYRSRIPVVCIGNIHSGGSGKTPLVKAVARKFVDRKPVVVSRGYHGKRSRSGAKVSLEESQGVQEYGDEAWMLARELRLPVYVGRRRSEVMRVVEALEDSRLIVMDDGFQHLAVHRDLDVIAISAEKDIEARYCLPRGELREPLSALGAASCFCLVTNDSASGSFHRWEGYLQGRFPHIPLFRVVRQVVGLAAKEPFDPPLGAKGFAFCGVGSPETFQGLLSRWPRIHLEQVYPDHFDYGPDQVRELEQRASAQSADFIVTTEKDWVKTQRHFSSFRDRAYFLRMEYEIPEEFWYFLSKRLDSIKA